MDDRLTGVETRIEELARRLEHLERKLQALEGERELPSRVTKPSIPPAGERSRRQEAASRRPSAAWILSLVGRTLIVLGGGFLLRAITESGVLSRSVGTGVGLLYGLSWFAVADVVGGRNRTLSASFHGLAGALIVFPVLVEAFTKYGFLAPGVSVAAVASGSLVALGVAWHRRLRVFAWIAVLAAGVSILGVSLEGRAFIPAASWFVLLGFVTLWIAYSRHWIGLAWLTALFVNTSILILVVLVLGVRDAEQRFGLAPVPVIAVQFAAVVAYLGSIAVRTLIRNRDVIVFEVVQTVVLLVLWLGSALKLAPVAETGLTPLGAGCIGLAAGCYGFAFALIDRRAGGRRNFIFYTTLAVVFALFGGGVLLSRNALALLLVVLAALTTGFGMRYSRITLFGHSVFYILAAAFYSGLFSVAGRALAGSTFTLDRWFTGPVLATLVVSVLMSAAPVTARRRTWGPLARVPRVLLLALVLTVLNGLAVALLVNLLVGGDPAADPGPVAAIRTCTLALSVFLLFFIGRGRNVPEATWLAFTGLALGGLKLVLEDLPAGRPATLFVSLAAYGAALLLLPRMLRRRAGETDV